MLPFLLPLISALGTSTLVQGALMGSALSGGIAALTGAKGSDIGKAALGGALTGGLGAGISGLAGGQSLAQLFGAGNTAAAGASAASALPVTEGIPNIIQGTELVGKTAPFVGTGSTAPSVATNLMGGDPLSLAKLGADVGTNAAGPGPVSSLISQASTPAASTFSSSMANAGPTGVSNFMKDASSVLGPAKTPTLFDDPLKYAMQNKGTAIAAGLSGLMAGQQPKKPKKKEPWQGLQWEYQPSYADGGIASVAPPGYDMMVGETPMYARGGVSDLGTYSDGGRMLKGAGDGMSDSIPGVIGGKRPARLADGEFVVPADVVSHLGNGSTDAGAKQLYKMMDKVRAARTGTRKQGRQINPRRFMPA